MPCSLFFDARGELDLRGPSESSLAVVTLAEQSGASLRQHQLVAAMLAGDPATVAVAAEAETEAAIAAANMFPDEVPAPLPGLGLPQAGNAAASTATMPLPGRPRANAQGEPDISG